MHPVKVILGLFLNETVHVSLENLHFDTAAYDDDDDDDDDDYNNYQLFLRYG